MTPVGQAIAGLLETRRLPHDSRHSALVMYSGGLDSLSLLFNLLMATELDIHVHHVEILNFENRADVETQAIARQLDVLRAGCRPFEYTTSRHEFMLGKGGGVDTVLNLFTAARVHTASGGKFWTIWTGHITPPEWEIIEGAAVLNAMFINKRMRPYWMRPLRRLQKPDILVSLPPELADLAWSCRTPVATGDGRYDPCGACHACTSMATARQAIATRRQDDAP